METLSPEKSNIGDKGAERSAFELKLQNIVDQLLENSEMSAEDADELYNKSLTNISLISDKSFLYSLLYKCNDKATEAPHEIPENNKSALHETKLAIIKKIDELSK